MNVKFNYLYRDGGNYKTFGSIIFINPTGLSINEIEQKLRDKLIDDCFFDPKILQVPALKHSNFSYDPELDHNFNEFESIEETVEMATGKRTINEFLD